MTRVIVFLVTLLALLCPVGASAHQLDPAYLELEALGNNNWQVTWRVPNVSGKPVELKLALPGGCSPDNPERLNFDGRAWSASWQVTCASGLVGGEIAISGLETSGTDALVRYELEPENAVTKRLTAEETQFTVPEKAGPLEVLGNYVSLGIDHILEGFDHLLFVFALLLLISDWKRLLGAVTAFTLAHSITLALAALNIVTVPAPPVEAVIALSIVFLAWELSLPPEKRDPVTLRHPWIVAFAFGLIHGLGFAGALREIGLPEGDIPLALLGFNVGVEIGQILFIAVVLSLKFAIGKLLKKKETGKFSPAFLRASSYMIGTIAAFWVIERIAAF